MAQVEAQSLLSRSAPLGEIVAEVRRLLTQPAPASPERPQAPGAPAPTLSHEAPGSASEATNAAQATAPASETSAAADAPARSTSSQEPRPAAPTQPLQPVEPVAARDGDLPAPASLEAHQPPQTTSSRPAPEAPAAGAPSPASAKGTQLRAEAGATRAQPAAQPAISRDVIELLQSLVLALPEPGRTEAPSATLPLPAAETPPSPLTPPGAAAPAPDVLPGEIRELVQSAPLCIEQLLMLVESRTEAALASLPESARIDVLIEALLRLPPPPAPATTPPVGVAAAAEGAVDAPAPSQSTAALLERLLAALSNVRPGSSDPQRPQLPPQLRAELESLDAAARTDLTESLVSRERRLIESSPELRNLSRAHRALQNAALRLQASNAGSVATSQPGAAFSYMEIPAMAGGEGSTARLRVMVKRDGTGTGAGPGAPGKPTGPLRAILDLNLSGLGEVWSELLLSGEDLAVRLELPDAARRDMVAVELSSLEQRLAARGFKATATAEARPQEGPAFALEFWPDVTDTGGLDTWA